MFFSRRVSPTFWRASPGAALGASLLCCPSDHRKGNAQATILAETRESSIDKSRTGWVPPPRPGGKSRLVFTGTGSSTGIPRPACLMQLAPDDPKCRVTRMSMDGPADCNPNYRCNPGLLVQYSPQDGGPLRNIQIDVGKTYREALVRWYPRFGVPWIDAVILTHDHADACFGLDELRTVQRLPENYNQETIAKSRIEIEPTSVFVGTRYMPRLRECFSYLMPQKTSASTVARFIAKINWVEFDDYQTFICPGGLAVTTVPVKHGKDYICAAFVFGEKQRVAYISDVTEVPDKTMAILEERQIELLVVDSLFENTHAVHFGLCDALALARRLRPKRTLIVGMADQFEHHEKNAQLKELLRTEGLDIQLARDGLHVDLEL